MLPVDEPSPWVPAVGLPVAIVAIGLVLGLLAFPTVSLATATVDTIDEEVFTTPELPEVDVPAQRSVVYANDGSELGLLVGEQNRVLVTLDEIPEVLRNAVIATEDADFYEHRGVNHEATMRALITNISEGDIEQGGSTITQQYVKNALLTPEQTYTRKVREALFALKLEREVPKDEILERYLNITYFGNGAYGVAAAVERYFGKALQDVTLAESAVLAGIIRSPNTNNPLASWARADRMRDTVLTQMLGEGMITEDEAEAARQVTIEEMLNPKEPPPPRYPFFTEFLKQQMLQMPELGETRAERIEAMFSGGLRIRTTLQPALQDLAQAAIDELLTDPTEHPMGGLISLAPSTGRIRAMAVGPKAFGECGDEEAKCETTKVNPLAPGMGGSGRQVGSSFKPILDAAALASGIPTSTAFTTDNGEEIDEDVCPNYVDGRREPWTPNNYSGTGGGTMDMPEAIRRSNNVYHAKMIAEVGPERVAEVAHAMGIDPEPDPNCAIALGAVDAFPIDMAEAFGTLANGGVRCAPFAIDEITDAEGNVIIDPQPQCERVLDQEVADTMVTMMKDVVQRGTATRARIPGWDLAGKTGTTNDFRDAWFVGFAKPLVTAAWVGFEIPESMYGVLGFSRVTGGSVPAQLWHDFMAPALEGTDPQPLPEVALDRYTPPRPSRPSGGGGGGDDAGGGDGDAGGGGGDQDGGGGNGGGNGGGDGGGGDGGGNGGGGNGDGGGGEDD